MKIGSYYTHPAADCLELIEGEEFKKLCRDIKANGLRDPIVLYHDASEVLLLDGRNRLRACLKTGVKPRFVDLDDVDPIDYVESKNLSRRHLTAGQRALAANKLAKLRTGQKKPEAPAKTGGKAGTSKPELTQSQAATKHHVSERYVRDARVVDEHAVPEVQRAAGRGELALDAAAALARLPKAEQRAFAKKEFGKGKEIKSGHVRALIHQAKKRGIAAKIEAERTPLPVGPYRVIVADPPWLFKNSDNHAGSRGHMRYPPMTTDAICALGAEVQAIAHPEGTVLWLWTTNAHLVAGDASRVVREWGFEAITMLTWRKSNLGMGSWLRNRTEHAILAVRGPATMVNTTQSTWLESITTSTDFEDVMRRVGLIHSAAGAHGRELAERIAQLADLHDQVERGATPATRLREMIGELAPLVARTTSEIKNACDELMHHPPADSLEAKVNGHSVKPPEFFAMVERTCPGSKLYMFPGQEKRDGWATWGEPNDTAREMPANRLLAAGSDEVKPANLPVSDPEPETGKKRPVSDPTDATPANGNVRKATGHKPGCTFEEKLEAKTSEIASREHDLDALTEDLLNAESGLRDSPSNIAWSRQPEAWEAELWGPLAKAMRNRAAANLRAGDFIVDTHDEDEPGRFRESYFLQVRGRERAAAAAAIAPEPIRTFADDYKSITGKELPKKMPGVMSNGRLSLELVRTLAPDTLLVIEWPGTTDGTNRKMAQFVAVTRTNMVNVRVERVTATGRPLGKYGSVRAISPSTVLALGPAAAPPPTAPAKARKQVRSWEGMLEAPTFGEPDSARNLKRRALMATITIEELREVAGDIDWTLKHDGALAPCLRAVFRDQKLWRDVTEKIGKHGLASASQYKSPKGYIEIIGRNEPPPKRSKATKFADIEAGLALMNGGAVAKLCKAKRYGKCQGHASDGYHRHETADGTISEWNDIAERSTSAVGSNVRGWNKHAVARVRAERGLAAASP